VNKKANLVGAAIALIGLAATAQADKITIKSIETNKVGSGLEVVVKGENLTQPKEMRILQGTTYIVEFTCDWIFQPGRKTLNQAGVKTVQWGWFSNKPPKVRLSFKLNPSVQPTVVERDGNWVIQIGIPVAESKPVAKTVNGVVVPDLPYPVDNSPKTVVESKPVVTPTKTFQEVVEDAKKTQATPPSLEYPRDNSKWPDGRPKLPNSAGSQVGGGRVSLDFVQTDIVQILKALAIQAGVNVIISPEVSAASSAPTEGGAAAGGARASKLTLSLTNVTVEQALDYVCALSGLRYMRTNNAYLITTADRFNETARQLANMNQDTSEIRIIPVLSGNGLQLREAVYRWFGRQTVEVMLPSEMRESRATSTTTGEKGTVTNFEQIEVMDNYLFLIGDAKWLDSAEALIRRIDRELLAVKREGLNAMSDVMKTMGDPVVQETYTVRFVQNEADLRSIAAGTSQGQSYPAPKSGAEKLAEKVKDAFKDVTFVASPVESANQVIIMRGPKSQVDEAMALMQKLDAPQADEIGGVRVMDELVPINFVDPQSAIDTLTKRFPGVQATLVPDYALPVVNKQREITTKVGNIETKHDKFDSYPRMAIALRGLPSELKSAKAFLTSIDVAPKQVALELRVMELTKEEALRVGIDWNLLTGGRLGTFRLNQGLGDNPSSPGTISGSYRYQANDTLSALATLDKINNGRNLIARPNALVTDGRTTRLFVGDIVRYIKNITSSQNGTTVQTDEIPVGVLFDFTVRVGHNNELVFHVDQNFSILNGFTPVPGGGQLPQTSERKTDMMVNMRSGETLAIGGLIQEQDRKRVSGIPILMDLPLIGQLFRRTDNSKLRTEIVFFLTAVVVDQETRPNAASPRTSEQRNPDPLGEYRKSGKGNGAGNTPN